jgi:pilus assembly protein CpaE
MAQLSGRIVSDDNEFKVQVGRLMRSGPTPVAVAGDPLTRDTAPPDILVADIRGDATAALLTIEQLRAWAAGACIVAVAQEAEPNLILKAMRAGVNEFLVWPPTEDAFNEAIRRAETRRELSQEGAPIARTMVFFGAKGGAGTTTVTVNCAVDVARMSKKPAVIVDLKPGLGEVALFLGVRPKYSLLDAIDNLPRLDKHMLSSLVAKHKSGLEILAGSDQFDRPAAADASAMGEVFRVLARNYDYIFIDAGNQINQQSVAALAGADHVFLVVTPDVPSIRNSQRLLNRLRQLGVHKDRVRILLNRAAEPFPIPPKQIEGALGHTIHHTFASDYKVVSTALNSGVPLAQTGKSDLATQFDRFSRDLLGPIKEEAAATGQQKKVVGLGRIGWVW